MSLISKVVIEVLKKGNNSGTNIGYTVQQHTTTSPHIAHIRAIEVIIGNH